MRILGNWDMMYNQIQNVVIQPLNNFPQIPKPGQIIFKNKTIYFCAEIGDGLPIWIPISGEIDVVLHTQSTPSTLWTINHNLNSSTVFVQVYDTAGRMIIPQDIDTSVLNTVTILFETEQDGRAVVMLGALSGKPKDTIAYTQSFDSSSVWVVTHGLGYFPVVRVYVGNYEVQPASIVNDSTTQLTVTFSAPKSGIVRCV